jgi:hypothetical protein
MGLSAFLFRLLNRRWSQMVRRLPAKQHQVGSIPTGVSYEPEANRDHATPRGSTSRLVGAAWPAAHSVPHPRLDWVRSAHGF